jgi:RNase H-fold protein (predicted Holliday junction resolvase)
MAKIKQKKLVDTVAAVYILQSYLDNKKLKSGGQNE